MPDTHNPLKYGSDLSGGISAVAGGASDTTAIERLDESLQANLDIFGRIEFAWPRLERLRASYAIDAADAVLFSNIILQNPLGSSAIITITDIWARNSLAGGYIVGAIGLADETLDVTQFGQPRDGRDLSDAFGGNSRSNGRFGPLTFAGFPGDLTIFQRSSDAAGQLELHNENGLVVLSPNTEFGLTPGVANRFIEATIWWRERTALPRELRR